MLKKYMVTLLLSVLTLGYLLLMDIITGHDWRTTFKNAHFQLFTESEKILVIFLFLCLFVPDLIHVFTSRKKSKSGGS